ncbi:3-deoxy-D-manno-octulosonic acid transferase [Natroniella sulfidigena]|uniref:3-deoxy-D-manno-octulosonic acid transferase n=1 Tax=Natroniella sulfidigena TaxID=723921 RepID=UPI00200A3682|nr:3-deoxy-D-manno-octulosonic acid transferase [Natroniella sulfidigena]MCK8816322.1 3-deoxy-D-manno-octulosonic acid transferase [Natroniella sulfidigena]
MKLIYIIYDILLLILFMLYLPVLLYKMIVKGKYREGILERFGFLAAEKIEQFEGQPTIWVHAVSVGETVAASAVVTEVKERYPEHKILFSTVTDTGQGMARQIVKEADETIYFPLDFSWVVGRALSKINPEVVILTETELWPNFIRLAKENEAKIMLANGRISDSSFAGYKYLGPILKDMLANVDLFSMQSEQDLEYIQSLGAEQTKVYNNGNTKFDQDYAQPDSSKEEELYQVFKLNKEQPILVVGSTHPNEEEQLLPLYQKLKDEFPELVMILAPRHIKRASEVESLYQQAGIKTVLRTEIETRDPSQDSVIILDTIGELAQIYGIADLVFVGGSLIEKGGHNILEPAVHGKLVFFGPYMFNFKANTRLVLDYGVGIQIEDVAELTEEMLYYLKNEDELKKKGRQAVQMIEDNQGAAERNAKLVKKIIDSKVRFESGSANAINKEGL